MQLKFVRALLKLLFLTTAGVGTMFASVVQVDLLNPSQTGLPGDLLQYFGTMTNLSPTDTVFFNSASSSSVSSNLTIDITPFLINAPLSLGPGEVSAVFDFFDIAIDPATPDGPYLGNIVSLQGGADSFTFDPLVDINADVTVGSSAAAPEPSSAGLLVAGAGFLAASWFRRNWSRGKKARRRPESVTLHYLNGCGRHDAVGSGEERGSIGAE